MGPIGSIGSRGLRLLGRWEVVLLAILLLICAANTWASEYFLDVRNLFDSTQTFSEKALIALTMTLVIIGRDIDLSVASIVALWSTAMAGGRAGAGTRCGRDGSCSAPAGMFNGES